MKLYRTLFLWACLAIAGHAMADELNVADLTINPGESKTVAVELTNPDHAYILLEFTLKLPEGVGIAKTADDKWDVVLNTDRFSAHELQVEQLAGGDYKFLIFSMPNTVVNGTSGEILTMTLTAQADAPRGNAQGLFYEQLFADADEAGYTPADKAFNIRVGGIPGDADDSGDVSVRDVTAVVSHLLGREPAGFVLGNADLDGDGQVTAEEVAGIVNIILGK